MGVRSEMGTTVSVSTAYACIHDKIKRNVCFHFIESVDLHVSFTDLMTNL